MLEKGQIKFTEKAAEIAKVYFEKKKVNEFLIVAPNLEKPEGVKDFYKILLGKEQDPTSLRKVYTKDIMRTEKLFEVSLVRESGLSFILSPYLGCLLYIAKTQESKYKTIKRPDSDWPMAVVNENNDSVMIKFISHMRTKAVDLADLVLEIEKSAEFDKKDIDRNSIKIFLKRELHYTDLMSLTNETGKFIFKAFNVKNKRNVALKIVWPDDNGINEKEVSKILAYGKYRNFKNEKEFEEGLKKIKKEDRTLYKYLNTPVFVKSFKNACLKKSSDTQYWKFTFKVFEFPLMDSSFLDYVGKLEKKALDSNAIKELRKVSKNLLKGYVEIYKRNLLPRDTGNYNILVKQVTDGNGIHKTRFNLSDFGLFETEKTLLKNPILFWKFQTKAALDLLELKDDSELNSEGEKIAKSSKKVFEDNPNLFKYQALLKNYQQLNQQKLLIEKKAKKLCEEYFKSEITKEKCFSVFNVVKAVMCLYVKLKEGKKVHEFMSGEIEEIVKKYKKSAEPLERKFLDFVERILSEKYDTPEDALTDDFLINKI
ncbi:MAG: hypothetical protein CfP315_0597 [Candidatus Improbicoccus pseudotrichonymphae]|uniref:Uncharacterized protein n=1 Tax=Candidatus Improbicoccus pseudotrichonymphae TaxID=3033792 RepID=A0AA48KZ76_9FIRM|nr:MAG: hypothetical protein CfP315_0597 [Candidatus Improbicoccus pseudotrichonymphae]